MSRVTVRPFASTALPALAQTSTLTFRELEGVACFMPGTLDEASVVVKIKAASLAFDDEARDQNREEIERLMRHAVLETDEYPEIVFRTSKVSASKAGSGQYWINLVADISLHGVTASEPVAAQVVFAGDTLFVRGELTLAQSTYRMKPAELPGGALRFREEVKCLFDVVARRQPEDAENTNKRMLAVEGP